MAPSKGHRTNSLVMYSEHNFIFYSLCRFKMHSVGWRVRQTQDFAGQSEENKVLQSIHSHNMLVTSVHFLKQETQEEDLSLFLSWLFFLLVPDLSSHTMVVSGFLSVK